MPRELSSGLSLLSSVLKLALLIGLLVGANYGAHWIAEHTNLQIRPSNEDVVHRVILASAVAYTVLLAIPFVPGVEIAISLIVMLGPKIVWLVYMCTVAGLCLSYAVSRLVPLNGLVDFLEAMSFKRASNSLREITPMRRKQRLEFLLSRASSRYVPSESVDRDKARYRIQQGGDCKNRGRCAIKNGTGRVRGQGRESIKRAPATWGKSAP